MKCPKHPGYKELEIPKYSCVNCWRIYFLVNGLSDKQKGRPIRLNVVNLQPRNGKDYAEVVFLGDIHLGSPQCDEERVIRQVDYCVEKGIYVFLMGDIIEMATRYSVGAGVYEQIERGELQVERAINLLYPLAQKHLIIGMLEGNHELRVFKETGIRIGNFLAQSLNTKNLGYACWNLFRVGKEKYTVYAWHGVSSARFPWTKLKSAVDTAMAFDCDLFAMGHVHSCQNDSYVYQGVDFRRGTVIQKKKFILITGHYLKYDRGYAQVRGYRPEKLGSPKVKFFGSHHDIHISW